MVKTGKSLWDRHPHVRSHEDLTLGERAADRVKAGLGSWTFIWTQTFVVLAWITFNLVALFGLRWDPYPFILLNLVFSTQAAYAAPILQLSQNRNDRVSAEIATGTHQNTTTLLDMQRQQTEILEAVRHHFSREAGE